MKRATSLAVAVTMLFAPLVEAQTSQAVPSQSQTPTVTKPAPSAPTIQPLAGRFPRQHRPKHNERIGEGHRDAPQNSSACFRLGRSRITCDKGILRQNPIRVRLSRTQKGTTTTRAAAIPQTRFQKRCQCENANQNRKRLSPKSRLRKKQPCGAKYSSTMSA